MLKLYNYFRSSASFRVRIALNLKKLPYEEIPVHLLNNGGEQFSSSYQAINPQCLVPALQHDDKVITQSLAIIDYLEELHPTPTIMPNNAYDRALVKAFALSIAADLHPLNNLRVLQFLTKEFGMDEKQKNTWYQHWINKNFSALEQQIINTANDFCFGDFPTLADICLVPQMYNARRYACDLSAFPTLTRIDANCQKHSAFIKAWPEDQS